MSYLDNKIYDKNDYIIKNEYKYYDNLYKIDNFKPDDDFKIIRYGNINTYKVVSTLSDEEIRVLYQFMLGLSQNEFRLLYNRIVSYKNSGSRITRALIIKIVTDMITRGELKSKPQTIEPQTTTQTVKDLKEEENKRLERIRQERERLEKERQERLERERLERERIRNEAIKSFLTDITNKQIGSNFRGWVLPNGILLSQYTDKERRQDHSSLVKIFMSGVEQFDPASYARLRELYTKYLNLYQLRAADVDESFAVETLGWMQVAVFGQKKIIYRAERWQDNLLRPFFMDYGFTYSVMDKGRSYELEFEHLYDNIDEIMMLGLKKKYENTQRL